MVVFVLLVVCPGAGSVDDMLDAENKRLAENLATKVSRLKSVSEDIGPAANLRSHSLLLVNSVLVKWWITPVFVSFNVSACV